MWGMKFIHHSPIHPFTHSPTVFGRYWSGNCSVLDLFFLFLSILIEEVGGAHHGLDCSKGAAIHGDQQWQWLIIHVIGVHQTLLVLVSEWCQHLCSFQLFPTLSNSFRSFSFSTPAIELCSCRRSCPSPSAAKPLAVSAKNQTPLLTYNGASRFWVVELWPNHSLFTNVRSWSPELKWCHTDIIQIRHRFKVHDGFSHQPGPQVFRTHCAWRKPQNTKVIKSATILHSTEWVSTCAKWK